MTDERISMMWDRILSFWEGDYPKTLAWFATQNPQLGEVRPMDMMTPEKIDRLKSWVDTTDA